MKVSQSILDAAKALTAANVAAESAITEVFLFPTDREIRLVELDPTSLPSDEGNIVPFYFPADPSRDLPYRVAVALIPPDEKGRAHLPAGWGEWTDAIQVWSRDKAAGR